MGEEDQVVSFYRGQSAEGAGRRIDEIWALGPEALEQSEDCVGWLFPGAVASPLAPAAPLATTVTTATFGGDPELRARLRRSLDLALAFYGLEPATEGGGLGPGARFEERSRVWLRPRSRDLQRLACILASLRMLGLRDEARQLFLALRELYADLEAGRAIGAQAFGDWMRAAGQDVATPFVPGGSGDDPPESAGQRIGDLELRLATLPEPGKGRNGDACGWAPVELPEGAALLIVACDGVSSSPRGADASRLAVRAFLHFACEASAGATGVERLRRAVADTQELVHDTLGGSGICTLAALLIGPGATQGTFASVGDSGIFVADASGVRKLNRDDVTARPRLVNGKPVLVAGTPVMEKGLTQALGQEGLVEPQVQDVALPAGANLAVASDGILLGDLRGFLPEAHRAPVSETRAFCDRMRRANRDDATLVLVCLPRGAGQADLARRVAAYGEAAADERDELLGLLDDSHQPVAAPAILCLRKEGDEPRALRLLALAERDAGLVPLAEWEGLLPMAMERGWRRLYVRATQVVARLRVQRR